jgi:hypothetical protein
MSTTQDHSTDSVKSSDSERQGDSKRNDPDNVPSSHQLGPSIYNSPQQLANARLHANATANGNPNTRQYYVPPFDPYVPSDVAQFQRYPYPSPMVPRFPPLAGLQNAAPSAGPASALAQMIFEREQMLRTSTMTNQMAANPLGVGISSMLMPMAPRPSANDGMTMPMPTAAAFFQNAAAHMHLPATGRRNRILSMQQDEEALSPYQCLVRKQIELFEASEADIHSAAQGRNRPICLRQVGIRCRHCGSLAGERRARGAVYFPSTLGGLYQTAQNMANSHLIKDCVEFPNDIREDLVRIRLREKASSKNTRKSAFGGGKTYWSTGLRTLGVIETSDRRLRFSDVAPDLRLPTQHY